MGEIATMTKKGQVTIPKAIREKLGLKAGKKIYFELRGKQAVLFPKIDDPMAELRKLRAEISFEEQEIQAMIKRSKEKWSALG